MSSVGMLPREHDKNLFGSSIPAPRRALHLAICVIFIVSLFYSPIAKSQDLLAATAFTDCPAKAYLTQGKQPSTFAVNLVTGDYNSVALGHGTSSPLNAVGFNTHDNFIYGWSHEHKQPVRVHNDWQIEPLDDVNITTNDFYIGDVSIAQNRYYVYRPGAANGLYYIGLDPEAVDYLTMIKVVDGSRLSLKIYDMAFHPSDGFAYSVDNEGVLYKINVVEGSLENLGNVGEKGVYGATYFDLNGNLYIGRNNDGSIFRVSINSGVYEAELFTIGPAAGTNDGSRCALAPLSDGTDVLVDFGDAPDSYGTSLKNNGARHGLSDTPSLYMGTSVDGESDSSFHPLSDDENSTEDDEDGVQFVTNFVENETSIVLIDTSGSGYLSAWVDFNRNGEFDDFEQIITDELTSKGTERFYINVPSGVSPGQSWARFRLSSTMGLTPTGGVDDGEVEDVPVSIEQQEVVVTSYPSPKTWTTVAFEDNWPFFGDYDMNDLVVYLRSSVYSTTTGISRVVIEGEIAAAGAFYQNGFGIRLPGVLRSQVNEDKLEFSINGLAISELSPLEQGREEAILIIANSVTDYVSPGEECIYYRTEPGCGSAIEMAFTLDVPMNDVTQAALSGIFDPFLFATPGALRGPQFARPPGREYEIHLKNQAPTEAFNPLLFNDAGQDASAPFSGNYFQSPGGMPWAIEVGIRWEYPLEHSEITQAYPLFKKFVETQGKVDAFWYGAESANSIHVFTD